MPKKYTEEEVKLILGYKDQNISMTRACVLLDEKEQIKISSSTLKKVWFQENIKFKNLILFKLKIIYYLKLNIINNICVY